MLLPPIVTSDLNNSYRITLPGGEVRHVQNGMLRYPKANCSDPCEECIIGIQGVTAAGWGEMVNISLNSSGRYGISLE